MIVGAPRNRHPSLARQALRACVLFGECARRHDRHHQVVAHSSDLTDSQWNLLEPLVVVSSKRGPKHGDDLRHVVDAMLYISHTGCQWRFLPEQFGPSTRVWSQFRRWYLWTSLSPMMNSGKPSANRPSICTSVQERALVNSTPNGFMETSVSPVTNHRVGFSRERERCRQSNQRWSMVPHSS